MKDFTGSDSDCKTKPFKFITLNGKYNVPEFTFKFKSSFNYQNWSAICGVRKVGKLLFLFYFLFADCKNK